MVVWTIALINDNASEHRKQIDHFGVHIALELSIAFIIFSIKAYFSGCREYTSNHRERVRAILGRFGGLIARPSNVARYRNALFSLMILLEPFFVCIGRAISGKCIMKTLSSIGRNFLNKKRKQFLRHTYLT